MQLHPDISFCLVQDRPVFLDLGRDRYFCLSGDLAAEWRLLVGGADAAVDCADLARRRLIVPGHDRPVEACTSDCAERSLLDEPPPPASLRRICAMAWDLGVISCKLRRGGLCAVATALARARRLDTRPANPLPALTAIAADFDRLGLLVGTHNRCLPRSLALGRHLLRSGYAPQIVLGVRLDPFRAHCWVEADGVLVNDRFDRVRHYTPIRRL